MTNIIDKYDDLEILNIISEARNFTLSELVFRKIRSMILNGEILSGEKIHENLQVSKKSACAHVRIEGHRRKFMSSTATVLITAQCIDVSPGSMKRQVSTLYVLCVDFTSTEPRRRVNLVEARCERFPFEDRSAERKL